MNQPQRYVGFLVAIALLGAATPSAAQLLTATASQSPAAVRPGQADVTLFTLTISSSNVVAVQLTALTLRNGTSGPGTQSQRDAELGTVRLYRDVGAPAYEPGVDVLVSQAVASDSTVRYSPINVTVPAMGSVRLHAVTNVPLSARDSDVLDVSVEATGDMTFSFGTASGPPLRPAGGFSIDGMSAAQIAIHPVPPDSILAGAQDALALDVTLPSNGYENDQLVELAVVNEGTASSSSDVVRVRAWAETGNGSFDPTDLLLGDLVFTGSRWQLSGISRPVPAAGLRVYVTVNIADLAPQGRTIQLALPTSPSGGVGMASGNDGPNDAVVRNPTARPISASNRVTWTSAALPSVSARPGDKDVPLLATDARNSYASARTMTALTVTNVTIGGGTQSDRDREIHSLTLRADGDGDGVLDGVAIDPILGSAIVQDGRASFTGLSRSIPAGATSRFFVTADVSLTGASDSDQLAILLAGSTDVSFSSPTLVVGVWPVDSGARATVDGMVAGQVANRGAPVATVGPSDGPVLGLDIVVPRNGYASDSLEGLSVINLGDADSSDVAAVALWRDGGDGVFSQGAGDDVPLGALTPQGTGWQIASLADPIAPAGSRLFVGVTITGSPRDSAIVRLAVPVGGISNRSGNDGPLDAPIANAGEITISNAPLLATLRTGTAASTIGQNVSVTMVVRNVSAEDVTSIAPSPLTLSGTGGFTLATGPIPATFDLAPAASDTFHWTYTAAAAGDVILAGSAHGTGNPSGLPSRSLSVASDDHRVFQTVAEIALSTTAPLPPTVTRGQTDVLAIGLTFTNGTDAQTAPVRVAGLRIGLEDGSGGAIVPSDLLSAVTVREGATVLLHKTVLESSGSEVALALTTPTLVDGGASKDLTIAIDVASAAAAPSLRVVLMDSTWIAAAGANDNAPVAARLQGGSFPVRSGVARLVSEATRLDVAEVPGSPARVGRGQAGVPLLTLRVVNPGTPGITSDARISSFQMVLTDSNGVAVAHAGDFLTRVQARTAFQVLADRQIFSTDGASLTLVLSPPLAVPVNAPVDLTLMGDVATGASIGAVRAQLGDSASFDVRDAGTGASIPAVYAAPVIDGPTVWIELTADRIAVRGQPGFPPQLTVGRTGVTALTAVLRHPGSPGTARVRGDSLVVQCRNEARQPLVPSTYVSRARVLWNGVEIGSNPDPPATAIGLGVSLAGSLLEPGDSAIVTLMVDVAPTAPEGFLELMVFGSGILAVDHNLGSSVTVVAEVGAELPMTSGLTRLTAPARQLVVDLRDQMPAALAGDGVAVPVGILSLTNSASSSSDSIFVDHLELRASDREFAALSIGSAVERVQAFVAGTLWAESATLTADSTSATLAAAGRLGIAAGQISDVELRVIPRASASTAFRVGCDGSGVGIVQPGSAVLLISAQPAPGRTFPLWTEVGSLAALTLQKSYSNFPNPFAAGRGATTFAYYLRADARVTLRLYTATGEVVVSLLDATPRARGMTQIDRWDGRNGRGQVVRNGVYVAELSVAYDDGSLDRVLRRVAVVR